jgi:hypothetical protein
MYGTDCRGLPQVHSQTVQLPRPWQGVQRGMFALFGLLKFHSVSLCGRLYPLPRRTTFRLRNALHLIEARNSVANVRGIFQAPCVAWEKRTWLRTFDHELAWLALP